MINRNTIKYSGVYKNIYIYNKYLRGLRFLFEILKITKFTKIIFNFFIAFRDEVLLNEKSLVHLFKNTV